MPYISIHALREEGDFRTGLQRIKSLIISIHALREEGDFTLFKPAVVLTISIHALREEGDDNYISLCDKSQ